MSELLTIGAIARRAGVQVHQVRYVIERHPEIQPEGRAGLARVYSPAAEAKIVEALTAIRDRHAAHVQAG